MKTDFEAEIDSGAEVVRSCNALMEGLGSFIVDGLIASTMCSIVEKAFLYSMDCVLLLTRKSGSSILASNFYLSRTREQHLSPLQPYRKF